MSVSTNHIGDNITQHGNNSIGKVVGNVTVGASENAAQREVEQIIRLLYRMGITLEDPLPEAQRIQAIKAVQDCADEFPHVQEMAQNSSRSGMRDFLSRFLVSASPALVEVLFSLGG